MKDEDFVKHLFIASTHSYILFFTDKGKCFWVKVHEIPQGGRLARGKAIVNLLEMSREEKITAMVPVGDFSKDAYLMMATKDGFIKKTHLSAYANPRRGGIRAINLRDGDRLIESRLTSGNDDVILAKKKGKAIRFGERDVREMGRATQGVKGVTLDKDDEVVDMVVVMRGAEVLAVTEHGYGKRTRIMDFRNIHRGGKGVVCIPTVGRNGNLVSLKEVLPTDEVMMITRNGLVIRCPVKGIPVLGRPAKGVRVISLNAGDFLVDVALIVAEENGDENGDENGSVAEHNPVESDEAAGSEEKDEEAASETLLELDDEAGEPRGGQSAGGEGDSGDRGKKETGKAKKKAGEKQSGKSKPPVRKVKRKK